MSGYLIISPQDTGWRLPSDEFTEALLARWPDAHVQPSVTQLSPGGVDARLRLPPREADSLVYFQEGPDGFVAIRSSLEPAIQVAVWYRRLAPSQHVLLFSDEGFNKHIELSPDASEADVFRMWYEPLLDSEVFGMLVEFAEREGTTRVPVDAIEGEFPFGAWVERVRWLYEQGWLSPEERARLDELPGWMDEQRGGEGNSG